ncbi:precorrin-6A reductase [Fictibacillus barbaricus]|uniref:Precorrin-6A reductase n=1 Tax=Fictibacillus barbaricus TaxID=182136 RepID=A0ABS2ZB98_9BACL|nr:precorrin-6A reductase [Fictibacillus barbaricus]MBN3545474.1 precorrin-6A reductase [Fictibacillus barbaricus]GGB53703.1 precorrin-6A reductase [Fictibacillus barbaricus]
MILFLAGTSDARELALKIQKAGYPLLATVVTENAASELKKYGIHVHTGRLDQDGITAFIKEHRITMVVDASHPFAEEASKNAMFGAKEQGVTYIRYERDKKDFYDENLIWTDTYEEAAEQAALKGGVVMLTTGSKTLQIFTDKLLGRSDITLIARMLPRKDNMEKCEKLGFPQKNIVAIQGPFSKEFNQALFQQFHVDVMVTKESGKQGAVDEKVEAALEIGISVVMIRRPKIQYENQYADFEEIVRHISREWRGVHT